MHRNRICRSTSLLIVRLTAGLRAYVVVQPNKERDHAFKQNCLAGRAKHCCLQQQSAQNLVKPCQLPLFFGGACAYGMKADNL